MARIKILGPVVASQMLVNGSVGYSALAALFSASILHFVHGVLCTVVRWLGGWGHDNKSEKFFTGLSVRSPSYLLTAIPACQFGHKGKDCQICLKDQNWNFLPKLYPGGLVEKYMSRLLERKAIVWKQFSCLTPFVNFLYVGFLGNFDAKFGSPSSNRGTD